MVQVVILAANGESRGLKTAAITGAPTGAAIAKALRKTRAAEAIGEYSWNKRKLSVWGWRDGKAGTENKHELPPPLDEGLLFGDAVVVASDGDLTVDDWGVFYDQAFGGFEDVGSETSSEAEVEAEDGDDDASDDADGDDSDGDNDDDESEADEDEGSEDEGAESEGDEADGDDGDCYEDGEEGGGSKRRPARRRAVAAPEYRRMDMGLRARVALPGTPGKRAPKWQTAAELLPEEAGEGVDAPLRARVTAIITRAMDQLLDPDQRADLERGIYNTALERARSRGVRRHWDNPEFAEIYKTVARRTVANLDPEGYVGNSRLIQRLQEGEFEPHRIAGMTARELYPEHWQELADEQLKRETTLLEGGNKEGSDMFKCKRCGKANTRYWQMQTRSADEPMTTFIRCLNCGKEWRE